MLLALKHFAPDAVNCSSILRQLLIRESIIIIFLFTPLVAHAQADAPAPPVSPLQTAMNNAREAARANDPDAAVAELQKLVDAGFTGVALITGDKDLDTLEGYEPYDILIADMTVAAYPCEYDEQFSEFDFWVGKWDVHVASGAVAGHNEITREQRSCVLIENWTSATGGGGMSINYVDKIAGEWVQVWNDASGGQINIRGGMTEEGMLLTGTIHDVASAQTKPFRGLWTSLEDGRVRQYFEQSDDDGETWVPWFEGFYTRSVTGHPE